MKLLLIITILLISLKLSAQADKQPRYDTIYIPHLHKFEVREWERVKIWDRVPHEEYYSHWSALKPYVVKYIDKLKK